MARSLVNGHLKFTILTTKPENPEAPTVTELEAGLTDQKQYSKNLTWSAQASDTVDDPSLADSSKAPVPTDANYEGSVTVFRDFGQDATADTAFQAVKVRGTELWCYARLTDKMATEPWAADDEIYLGGHVITDNPQFVGANGGGGGGGGSEDGYIKATVALLVQEGYDNITVAADTGV